jgi:hypothetical protein
MILPFALLDNETTWNFPDSAEIELLSLESIADIPEDVAFKTPFQVITETLSIDEESWDCWLNHFWDYFWSELEAEDLTLYFEILGWTQETWDDDSEDGPEPETEELFWDELSPDQKTAALYICYFPELWNDVEIREWTYVPPVDGVVVPVTAAPTSSPVVAPAPAPSAPTLPNRKVAPQDKCGSLARADGRGGAAAEAKDCVSRRNLARKPKLKGRR